MPYIKPYWFRILLGFAIAIPLGLLDGVTAFALKPYMDYVIGGKTFEFTILNHDIVITSLQMSFLLPIGVVLFAAFQGVLRYLMDIYQLGHRNALQMTLNLTFLID